MHLNTELGFVIDSPELAEDVEAALAAGVPDHAYEVRLDEKGRIYWIDQRSGDVRQLDTEPNTSRFKRGLVAILERLPIEWLL
jgi:putative cardiolipin synthase